MIFDITTSNITTIKTENLEVNTVYDKRNYSLDTTADTNVTQPMTMYDIDVINDVMFEDNLLPTMIYLILLMVIGLPGNSLVCYIYHKGNGVHTLGRTVYHKGNALKKTAKTNNVGFKMRSTTIFILALAWLDVLNCVVSLPIEIVLIRNAINFDHPWVCKISRYFVMVMNSASSCVLLGIAIDRFVGINCQQSKHRFTSTTAKKCVVVSIIFAIVSSIPALLLYGTITVYVRPGVYGKTCLIEDKFINTNYPFIHTVFLLSTHIVGDIVFITIYGYIGWKIFRHRNGFGNFECQRSPRHKLSQERYTNTRNGSCTEQCAFKTLKSQCARRQQVKVSQKECTPNDSCTGQRYTEHDNTNILNWNNGFGTRKCQRSPRHKFSQEEYANTLNGCHTGQCCLEHDNTGTPNWNKRNIFTVGSIEKEFRQNYLSPTITLDKLKSNDHKNYTKKSLNLNDLVVHGNVFKAKKTSFMLCIVTIVFLFTFAPYCVIAILRNVNSDFYKNLSKTGKTFYHLFLRSYLLSSAVNPIIYSFLSIKFRQQCKHLVSRLIKT